MGCFWKCKTSHSAWQRIFPVQGRTDPQWRKALVNWAALFFALAFLNQQSAVQSGQNKQLFVCMSWIVIQNFSLSWLFLFLNKTSGLDCNSSPRRRAYSTNQIIDYNPAKKVFTPSDPSSVVAKNPLRRAKVQELIGQMSPEHETQWRNDYQVCSHMMKSNICMIAFEMICSGLVWKMDQ